MTQNVSGEMVYFGRRKGLGRRKGCPRGRGTMGWGGVMFLATLWWHTYGSVLRRCAFYALWREFLTAAIKSCFTGEGVDATALCCVKPCSLSATLAITFSFFFLSNMSVLLDLTSFSSELESWWLGM